MIETPLRILLVAPSGRFVGGVERHVHELARGLAARGHSPRLVAARLDALDDAYLAPFSEVLHSQDLERAVRDADVVYAHKPIEPERLARVAEEVPVLVAAHDHDLTCVRSHRYLPVGRTPCGRAPGMTCVLHGCSLVRHAGSPLGLTLRDPFALRRQTTELARHVTYIAASRYLADSLIAAGVPPERTRVVHPAPRPSTLPLTPAPAAARLAFLGQIVAGKGLDLLLRALALLPDATLTIAGDGSGRAEAERLAAQLQLGPRALFLGALPPAATTAVIDQARVVVVPSRWPEPFGMVGVESMLRKRPVVAARHGGIPEWLHEGAAGCGFRPGDTADLAAAIRLALAPDTYDRRAEAGARIAADRFSFEAMIGAVERELRAACSAPGHAPPRTSPGGTRFN